MEINWHISSVPEGDTLTAAGTGPYVKLFRPTDRAVCLGKGKKARVFIQKFRSTDS